MLKKIHLLWRDVNMEKLKSMTEVEEFNFLWSFNDVFKAGWLDGRYNRDSIYDTQKKYDCLKERYCEGYFTGRAYMIYHD